MHIGIDASRTTVARRTGTESYSLNLTRALLRQAAPRSGVGEALRASPAQTEFAPASHRVTLYFRDQPAPGLFPSATQRVIPFPRLWTHARLSWEMLTHPPDVLFVPAHVLPLVCPAPAVVTVHDLGYRHFPDAHPLAQRLYLDWSTRFSAQRAAYVIADSQATRRDLARFYAVPENNISVVYPGRDETLRRVDPSAVRGALRVKYQLPETFLLHVGTLQPRKNLLRLIEAVSHQPSVITLVLAGRPGWQSQPILAAARTHNVRVLEYVPDEDLAGLYSGAAAFIFPSLYEGFGFPVLEAMACGTPVICANTSSLPEVAGEAALTVDPLDTEALTGAITRVLGDAGLRESLIAKGYAQVQKFSWEKAARETLSVLERAARR
ncbi:MAG: glycosyltransferase family 4 protein [Anaerolineales bacterium]